MECEEAAEILNRDYNIAVRAGYHCAPMAHRAIGTAGTGCVRLSPGLFTSEEELKKTARLYQPLYCIIDTMKQSFFNEGFEDPFPKLSVNFNDTFLELNMEEAFLEQLADL